MGHNFSSPEVQNLIPNLPYDLVSKNDTLLVKIHTKDIDQFFTPQDISSHLLLHLKSMAELYLGRNVTHTVICVPSSNSEQKNAVAEAGEKAGLTIQSVINPLEAAGVALGFYDIPACTWCKRNCKVLVYDTETSLITLLDVYNWEILGEFDESLPYPDDVPSTLHDFSVLPNSFQGRLHALLIGSNVGVGAVSAVALMGSSPDIPLDLFSSFLPNAKMLIGDAQTTVRGTAVIADRFRDTGCDGCCGLLMDVTMLSLGIEDPSHPGVFVVLVPVNHVIPLSKSRTFTFEKEAKMRVLIGQRKIVEGVKELGAIDLDLEFGDGETEKEVAVAIEVGPEHELRVMWKEVGKKEYKRLNMGAVGPCEYEEAEISAVMKEAAEWQEADQAVLNGLLPITENSAEL
jgi:molecular chaperone DnaK (HSP70)